MKKIDKTITFNVEELTRLAISRKTIKPRFRFPLSTQQAQDMLTAFYNAEVWSRQRNFINDAYTQDNISQIARYLSNESSKIGLLLCGTCGNGKTTCLYALRSMTNFLNEQDMFEDPKTGIVIYSAKDIAYYARCEYQKFMSIRHTPIIAIDDMGQEPNEVIDYGNIQNPIVELISYRYNEQLPTFVTTNQDPDGIKEKYGIRISDRFREMFDVVVFENEKSYR